MNEGFWTLLAYTLIPAPGWWSEVFSPPYGCRGERLISSFQHFAGGVVFSAVAVELLPQVHALDSPIAMILGFAWGSRTMLIAKALFENAGIIVPLSVDLFIDGLLIAVGFAAGVMGGTVLLAGLTLETLSLGLSTTPSLVRRGMRATRAVLLLGAIGLVILLGAAVGEVIVGMSGAVLAGVLGFGVASLLYLVTEELLAEAHEVPDTPIVTATFFAGFLLPIVIAAI